VISKKDPTKKMKVLEWCGAKEVRVVERPRPMITDPNDVILRVTSTAICGSDLHLYHKEVPGMEKGDIMGHEFMGIIESAGRNNFSKFFF
jgi:threonine dehydrogenase-like Zn-dependent dehydrogenase